MVVQFFVTVGFISSYLGQIVIVGLLLRYPMERILKYEWQFVGLAFVFKSLTGVYKKLGLSRTFIGGILKRTLKISQAKHLSMPRERAHKVD